MAACPGTTAAARTDHGLSSDPGVHDDPIWGRYRDMAYAWAGDPAVRFEAATGGVLTALGMFLVAHDRAAFVLHVAADPRMPMRSSWVMSDTAGAVRSRSGSRYGPTAPLAGLGDALDRDEPFAIIAKPCDLGAVHALAASDERVDRLCVARLAMVCGGQSSLEKSADVLAGLDVEEDEVTVFRYRGHGNPGPTRIETADGRAFELTYDDMWADEAGWKLESRCTICPDALGEAADVAAGDVWPGGGPSGEDDGFNSLIVRTRTGADLVAAAVEAGALIVGDTLAPRDHDGLQPHQVRKKRALAARNEALSAAGRPVIVTSGLRVAELGRSMTTAEWDAETARTRRRIAAGRYTENPT